MSTNVSKKKREDLLSKIGQIRTFIASAPQDTNTGNLLSYLSELEKDINGKKYGLIFEEHKEHIDEVLELNTPVLNEDKDLFINNGEIINFLIEGDNLASLQMLEKTHRGKVDLIYIDPPYNTLKDGFTYSDTLVDKNDTFRHSKWLSFMRRRLVIAQKLLSSNGTIFISIDDNEVAALRVLCDELFGYQNFVANIIWEKKFSPQNDAKWLSDSHDHILLYAKNKEIWHPKLLERTVEMDKRYTNPDNDPRGPWTSSDFTVKTASEAYMYDIVTPSGRVVRPTSSRSWATSEENYLALRADNRIWFGAKGNNVPRIKTFLSEVQKGTVCKTIWYRTEVGDTQEGTRDLKSVFGKAGMFTNPKPIRLINRILDIASQNNSIVLDFFAGSGTTGHALLNHYGISIKCIIDYLNAKFKQYSEECSDNYLYTLIHEIMPGDDFLTSLKKAKTTSFITLTVSKDDLNDDFMRFANRTDISDEVQILIKKPRKAKKFPENLIKAYYEDMQSNNKIKKIAVKGTNESGTFEAATDLIKMKHYLTVEAEGLTNEVCSSEFFNKAQTFIDETRR